MAVTGCYSRQTCMMHRLACWQRQLCLDVPILVNRHIVGGWKYVHSETGAFFDSVDNVVPAFREIIDGLQRGDLHPREWFKCVPKLSCLSLEMMHVWRPLTR